MQTLRFAILVSIFSTTTSFASADQCGQCTCNAFPGNRPGIGLFSAKRELGYFPANPLTNSELEKAMQKCADRYEDLKQKGVCTGELLINEE